MRVRFAALGGSAGLLGLALLVSSVSCKSKYPPDQPVKAAPEACCKFANETMTKFAGCRLTHRCAEEEPIWLRGAVSCGVVDPDKCGGGRCCKLAPVYGTDGVLNWDDGDEKKAAPPAKPEKVEPPPPVEPATEAPPPTEPPPAAAEG